MPDSPIGTVFLTVTDLRRSHAFYHDVLGLRAEPAEGGVRFLAPDGRVLVSLSERRHLLAPSQGPGLFHFAVLVPSRRELARALAGLEQADWPLEGASDHGVSEALYLADPDGHGIEIYADRPRAMWRRAGDEIAMGTEALDVADLLGELHDGADEEWAGLPAGTVMGHIHLRVRDLDEAERFYVGLSLEVTVRSYRGARFFAAGGYHHHVGVNTWWRGRGEDDGAGRVGLEAFEISVPEPAASEVRPPDGSYTVIVRPMGEQ
jgi:catechol 2,3-dioxygenase